MDKQITLTVPSTSVAPILLTLVATALVTCTYHFILPSFLRLLTRPPPPPTVDSAVASQLATLRLQSAALNTPATFAEWSKVQRQLQRLERQQQQQPRQQHASPPLVQAAVYTALAAAVGAAWWTGRSLVLAEVTGGEWLRWTPARLLLGEIGVLRWSLICCRVLSLATSPRRTAAPSPAT